MPHGRVFYGFIAATDESTLFGMALFGACNEAKMETQTERLTS